MPQRLAGLGGFVMLFQDVGAAHRSAGGARRTSWVWAQRAQRRLLTFLTLVLATSTLGIATATLVPAREMQSVGLRTDAQETDFASRVARRANQRPPSEGGWHIFLTYWDGLGASDPVSNVPMQATCGDAWPGWPCDVKHQALIDTFPYAATPAQRQHVLEAVQVSAYRPVPYGMCRPSNGIYPPWSVRVSQEC